MIFSRNDDNFCELIKKHTNKMHVCEVVHKKIEKKIHV